MRTQRPKPFVGQILYSLNINNAARNGEQKLTPVTVTKIGRKYFECARQDGGAKVEYHLDTWAENIGNGPCRNSELYETVDEWEREKLITKAVKLFKSEFSSCSAPDWLTCEVAQKLLGVIAEAKAGQAVTL